MKKIAALLICSLFTAISMRADLLFSDNLNYPDGLIETDGQWYCYSPTVPHQDAFVTNDLLILDQANFDSVAAPTNNFSPAGSIVYASFTINVGTLPTYKGTFFSSFKGSTNVYIANIFIATTNTTVPGTYQLGIGNAATSVTTPGVELFPLDLATGITYQVVFSYDENAEIAQLWVNPASSSDTSVEADDSVTNSDEANIAISQIAFSQYFGQGVEAIGNILVGDNFSDVVTNPPQVPVVGIEPQDTNFYSGNNLTLYVAASGTGQLTYQWLSNSVPLSDDGGVTVSGSQSNIVTLNNLQVSAGYSVIVADSAGSVTSRVATISVDSTPTPPFFVKLPYGATNSLFSSITLSALANGTGPLTYQWYFEATNASSFTALSGQTNTVLYLDNLGYTNSGLYYIEATGGDGSTNSTTNNVLVTAPINVTIAQLHSLMQTNNSGSYTIGLGAYVTVQGVVTSFAPFSSATSTAGEFYMEDTNGTSGIFVYIYSQGSNSVPAAGTLVSVTGPCQVYSGQLEIDPNQGTVINGVTNGLSILATNYPLPPSQAVDFGQLATNSLSAYGLQMQCALVTFTNVYVYTNYSGAVPVFNFPTNKSVGYYLYNQPYAAGLTNVEMYIYGSTGEATNFWGQLIPGHCYEINGIDGQYKTVVNFYPTRYVDLVASLPAPFSVNITKTNGVSQLTWPTITGSTYSVYSATNITGPWTQTFGLSYYPSIGIYTSTNAAATQFYKVSSP